MTQSEFTAGLPDEFFDIYASVSVAREGPAENALLNPHAVHNLDLVRMLNVAFVDELISFLRYMRHYFLAAKHGDEKVRASFLKHGGEEMLHADRLADRIVELGGTPDFSSHGINVSKRQACSDSEELDKMIRDDLVDERIAIVSYRRMLVYMAGRDPVTEALLADILAGEERHARHFEILLQQVVA